MDARRIINRNYLCRLCGKMRRAPADYVPGAPEGPQCCDHPMTALSYEATVAATQLTPSERTEWVAAGCKVEKRTGRRRWKAVW